MTFVPVETVTPSRSSCFAAERDSFSGYVGRTTSSASISRIRASGGWILRKSRRSVSLAISPSAPASSTPVGPPPTTTNVIHSCRTLGIGLALGRLERDQDPPAHLERVLDGLEARRERRPLVVAEVRVAGAGRHDQRVVVDRPAVRHQDLALVGIEADRLAEQDGRVPVLAHDRAKRLRDLARREGARGHLVEQRLEQVEVAPVDERDRDGSVPGEVLRGVQAGEPAPDDHDVVGLGAPWQTLLVALRGVAQRGLGGGKARDGHAER